MTVFAQPLITAVICVLAQGAGPSGVSTPATPSEPPMPLASAHAPEDLAGTWKYNADLSVNAATGRPETARAANERRGVGPGGGLRRGGGTGGPGGGAGAGGPGGPGGAGGGSEPNPFAILYAMQRDTQRDLLEIAPELRITVTPGDVTVVDDLNRSLTFPTDARKQKYQLGAATFDARTYWDAGQLKKDIDGPEGLKMNETYFLSEDGNRLFVVIRVGDRKDSSKVGVNRVYDRAQ